MIEGMVEDIGKEADSVALSEGEKPERRRRRRLWQRFFALLACLTVMIAAMLLTVSAYVWFRERTAGNAVPALGSGVSEGRDGAEGDSVRIDAEGNVVDAEGNVIGVLSGAVGIPPEEVERRVAEAKAQAAAEMLEGIRTGLNGGDTALEVLRPLYPDDLIVYSGGQYHVVPIDYSLKRHQLDEADLNILDTGEYQYLRDGQVISRKGIDVSRHQGDIDWSLVAQDGVEFAFIRVGYRGYETGKLMEDERFDANIRGAQAAGIKVGVYFYSQAVSEEEALEEAGFVLEKIAPYRIECPVVFDVEKAASPTGRMNAISVEERTAFARLFCQTIGDAGYRPMLYYNTEMGVMMLGLGGLEQYDKWFAAYSDSFYYPYEYKIWQYSQSGRVQGIKGDVDLNISFGPLWE